MHKLHPLLNKGGKVSVLMTILVIVGILAGGVFIYTQLGAPKLGVTQQTALPNTVPAVSETAGIQCSQACPDTGAWTGTVSIQNKWNGTDIETFDTSSYFYVTDPKTKALGSLEASVTDTTSGTVTLTCGRQYTMKTASTSGGGGDGSWLYRSDLGKSDGSGNVVFDACGRAQTFNVVGEQHGLWEARAYDIVNNGYLMNQSNASGLVYHVGTPLNFTSTTSNTTGTAIGAAGELHVRMEIRATAEDENLNDRGIYMLVDAASNRWNKPTVMLDGSTLQDIKSSLSEDEKVAYANYEYAYKIPQTRAITRTNEAKIDFSMFALTGINPTAADQPLVDFAPIGQVLSTRDANVLKVQSVNDNTGRSAIHTLEQLIFAVQ